MLLKANYQLKNIPHKAYQNISKAINTSHFQTYQLQEDLDNAERRLVMDDPMKYHRPGFSFEGPRLFGTPSPYLSLGPRPTVNEELHSPWGF